MIWKSLGIQSTVANLVSSCQYSAYNATANCGGMLSFEHDATRAEWNGYTQASFQKIEFFFSIFWMDGRKNKRAEMSVRTSTSVVAFSICRYRYLSHMCGTCVKGYGSPLPIEKKNLKEIIFFPFFFFYEGLHWFILFSYRRALSQCRLFLLIRWEVWHGDGTSKVRQIDS